MCGADLERGRTVKRLEVVEAGSGGHVDGNGVSMKHKNKAWCWVSRKLHSGLLMFCQE